MSIEVCMVSYALPPLYSGAGMQALRLSSTLRSCGINVSILAARHRLDFPPSESLEGVPILRVPVLQWHLLRRPTFALQVTQHLLRHSRRYDIVHIHGAYWRIWPILQATPFTDLKSVVKLTQMGTDDPQTISQRPLGRILLKTLGLADAVVSTSADLSASYRASGLPKDRLVQIPNGVDTDTFSPVDEDERLAYRHRLDLPIQGPLILFIGRVGYRKGIDILLTAWQDILTAHPAAHLLLVGPIGEADSSQSNQRPIQPWIAETPNVLAIGKHPNPEDYLKAADIFVLPSRREGLPNALLEAMATGLPCIGSNIGGNRELVENNSNGLLFTLQKPDELTMALLSLLGNPSHRRHLGQQARETVEAVYSLDRIAKSYIALYHKLLSSKENAQSS